MQDVKETCVNHVAPDDYILFSSSERKWINKVLKFKEKYPEAVKIIRTPEDNWGMLYAELPASWLKISPPRQVNYTEEQKMEIAKRLAESKSK
jgi:hypothetical protein